MKASLQKHEKIAIVIQILKDRRSLQWLSFIFTQRQRSMREHLCSHMATVWEREKFAKRACYRFRTFFQ